MREFAFELALCARLEGECDGVLARQLGAGVRGRDGASGNATGSRRVLDVVHVTPGPAFDERVALSPETIPAPAIESDVGPGRARYWKDCFDCHPGRARAVTDRAVEVGFFERERRNGREYVRQAARYPDDWFGRVRAVENKPDLSAPGELALQARKDVSLALADEVVVATASHVTGAHLNRLPDAIGVWQFDPATGEREVVREPARLPVDDAGIQVIEAHPGRTDVAPVTADEKRRARRRLAERAYGKGWRPAAGAFPPCVHAASGERFGAGALPDCAWKGRLVDPGHECGPDCPGFARADPPDADPDGERARRTAWDPDAGRARRQAGLDRFTE